jgi:MFS family permease
MLSKIFKKDEIKLLFPFYIYYFIFGFTSMIMPFMIIYFINKGFSFFEISLITSALGIGMFLFEIPTGAFADSYSRKYSLIIGFVIICIFSALIPSTNNLYLLILFWGFMGIGLTFVSGAEEAWVIDNLNHFNREDLHNEIRKII